MIFYARSASTSAPNQSYPEHVSGVLANAVGFWAGVSRYWRLGSTDSLADIVRAAAEFHDLGKLDDLNQRVLSGKNSHAHLPVPHQDAGVAHLIEQKNLLAALLVYAHHIGLPDLCEVQLQKPPMRLADATLRMEVDRALPELLRRHKASGFVAPPFAQAGSIQAAIDFRILFSCLTHADHSDAAQASGESAHGFPPPELRAEERLAKLKEYVASKPDDGSDRNRLRREFFTACAERGSTHTPITCCDAPVGTGKTTSVMARLLVTAAHYNLRRVFVILPFTNIITQSARTYRESLVLPNENPESVVAEIHHRADFNDRASRKLTALWNAPIVITTAVAFFETLASATPSTLRRLQNLPGSAIFLDEAHAMLPAKLLPLAWHWINQTAEDWQCFWTLASGSLSRFWEIEEFSIPNSADVFNILRPETQLLLASSESVRVTYRCKNVPMSLSTLCAWLETLDDPVLVVLNTVHTAAAAARAAESVFGEGNVLHLSTALSPADREITLELVRRRLENGWNEKWCLVATSCVEAGVDLSFRTGVRECSSLASLLQLAGRINRNEEDPTADVWTVLLDANTSDVVTNPAWSVSARVLFEFFERGIPISPAFCTEALKRELREGGISSELETLSKAEKTRAFRTVEKEFRVIEDETFPTVVDKGLIERIERFEDVSWRDIQNGSVHIRKRQIEKLRVDESRRYPGVFLWKYEYTPFLGYMAGILSLSDVNKDGFALI